MRIGLSGDVPVDREHVRRAVRGALRPYGVPPGASLTVAFVDDTEMRRLNKAYRGLDRTTDVLSFGQALPSGLKGADAVRSLRREADGACEIGDIVISTAQARRQARHGRRPLSGEIAFLAAHGALHLVGFEDGTTFGYREMVRLGTAAAVGATKAARKR